MKLSLFTTPTSLKVIIGLVFILSGSGCAIDEVLEEELGTQIDVADDQVSPPVGEPTTKSCEEHNPYGAPSPTDQIICYETFSIGYNYDSKQADWVSYTVTADSVAVYVERTDDFREDVNLPESARSTLSHYSGSGFDRGHLAPAATVGTSESTMSDTFVLSNMSPQLPGFNRDGWAEVEARIRDCVYDLKDMTIVTGPVIADDNAERIGGNGPVVPESFFKLLIHGNEAYAMVFPHAEFSLYSFDKYVVSPSAIEESTGLRLFEDLSEIDRDEILSESVNFCGF